MPLKIREKKDCRWDLVSLGEVMVRFDPGDRRIATARTFEVCEGGGEYNVARGLKRCFGLDTAIVTAFADDPVGKLLQDLLYQGGVDQTYVKWLPHDGVGRSARNGLNFTERGFGVRAAAGSYDRGHTAVSHLKPGDFDWDEIFGKYGARWLHTGGIFCALSDTTPKVALEAMQAARKHGVIVSYDLNYRASLWKTLGGKKRAQEVNREIAPFVDVMIGNEEDFSAALGFEVPQAWTKSAELRRRRLSADDQNGAEDVSVPGRCDDPPQGEDSDARTIGARFVTTTVDFFEAKNRENLEIFDRVGGRDSFASSLIYGFLAGQNSQFAVDCGAAHGALAMTTPGDTSMATLDDVLQVMKGVGARISVER